MADDKERAAYGNGTVYQSGNRYVAQLQYTIEINGKEYSKRISGTGATSAKAVRKRNKNKELWEAKLRKELEDKRALQSTDTADYSEEQTVLDDKSPTLNEVFYLNLKRIEAQAQIPTSENYEMYYNGYVRNHPLGNSLISEITEEQLRDFYTEMKKSGRKRTKKDQGGQPITLRPLSVSTINHIRFVLANTFKYAMEKQIIKVNPHATIGRFKTGTAAMLDYDQEDIDADSDDLDALHRIIVEDDMVRFLDYAYKHSRLAGLFAWAANSGMREGECLGLKRVFADPEREYVSVKKSLTYIKDRRQGATKATIPKLKAPKNGKERKVPYNQNLRDIYEYQMAVVKREKEEAGGLYCDRGLLFADEYGDFLRPWKVLKEFHQILDAVDIKKHRFHDLRHTFVSLMVRESQKSGEGVSILDVCAIVGHSDPTVTLKIYGGLFPDSTKTAMKILDGCNAIKIPERAIKGFCA